jgi:hypothetical protein
MPNPSWGTPAEHCLTGSVHKEDPTTPCSVCYARRGRFNFPKTKAAYQRRYDGQDHPRWAEAMIYLIGHSMPVVDPHMRIFDTGDLRDIEALLAFDEIARRLPMVWFWLPTQEWEMVTLYRKRYGRESPNLLIRFSARHIDEAPTLEAGECGSMTSTETETGKFTSQEDAWVCEAGSREHKCGPCRACWSPDIPLIVYPLT